MGDTIQTIWIIFWAFLLVEIFMICLSGMTHIESYLVSRKIKSELIKSDPIFKNVKLNWKIGEKKDNSYKFWIKGYSENNPFQEIFFGNVFLVGDKIILNYWIKKSERIETEFKIKRGNQW